jgi:diguanylate cyclase (GGDEF)-like protein
MVKRQFLFRLTIEIVQPAWGDEMKRFDVDSEKSDSSSESQKQFELINEALDSSEEGFAIWKPIRAQDQSIEDFTLLLINKTGAQAVGLPQKELTGKILSDIVGDGEPKTLNDLFEKALNLGHSVKELVTYQPNQGPQGVFENSVVPFGKDLVFATFRDVTDQAREQTRLLWLSEHDYLTGLPNRSKLQEALTRNAYLDDSSGLLTGFAFIDIDYFKKVNDTYGHDVGDAVLVNFAKRIRHSLPESAMVARISGDEFGVLLHSIENEGQLSDLMTEVFSAMARPFKRDELEISITCSAGCVLTDGSLPPEEIMRLADKVMYRAKHQGRNQFLVDNISQPI